MVSVGSFLAGTSVWSGLCRQFSDLLLTSCLSAKIRIKSHQSLFQLIVSALPPITVDIRTRNSHRTATAQSLGRQESLQANPEVGVGLILSRSGVFGFSKILRLTHFFIEN